MRFVLASAWAAAALLPAANCAPQSGPRASQIQIQRTASGKKLFERHCASCHFAQSRAQKIGPGLQGLTERPAASDGKRVSEASLTRWIEAGGRNMPGFKQELKPDEIRDLVSYLRTL